jgi:hypothetical protein
MMARETKPMEIKNFGSKVAVATFISLAIFTPVSAMADPTPTASPDTVRNPFEQYQIDRENFNNAVKMRSINIRNINVSFKNACDKAAIDFRNAMSVAKTPDQKNQAANARKNAINAAIAYRDGAIEALGPEPTPPVEPMKVMKAPKGKSR